MYMYISVYTHIHVIEHYIYTEIIYVCKYIYIRGGGIERE